MKALIFDPGAGASGDMILGCLLDLGADRNLVREAVESVGCRLEISRQERSHITVTRAIVTADRRYHSLAEAVSILKGSTLKAAAQKDALSAVDTLAEAESRVHGVTKEELRFHEIGALDALADIAGSCAARHALDAERVLCRSISVGGGYIKSAHGLLPVPGPAVLEILRSHAIPWMGGPVDQELLTPTGAALLTVLVDEFVTEMPHLVAAEVGYGAGARDHLTVPNVLRGMRAQILPGRSEHAGPWRTDHGCKHGDCVVQLETNVDDVSGEVLGRLMELLMDAGALDVSILPALMKKGRGGSVIRAIARNEAQEKLAGIMIRETGSLGVRVFPSIHRYVADREDRTMDLEICGRSYKIRVKVSRMAGELLNAKPEYEDCRMIAEDTGLPLRVIIKKAEEAAWRAAEV